MNPEALLSQLKDVHTPDLITWWPLAPGWWILIALTFITTCLILFKAINHYRKTAWKRNAKVLLEQLKKSAENMQNIDHAAEINTLLKRCLICSTNNHEFASMTTNKWESVLQDQLLSAKVSKDDICHLAYGSYSKKDHAFEKQFYVAIEHWIRGLKA